jgi:hypothetical protein
MNTRKWSEYWRGTARAPGRRARTIQPSAVRRRAGRRRHTSSGNALPVHQHRGGNQFLLPGALAIDVVHELELALTQVENGDVGHGACSQRTEILEREFSHSTGKRERPRRSRRDDVQSYLSGHFKKALADLCEALPKSSRNGPLGYVAGAIAARWLCLRSADSSPARRASRGRDLAGDRPIQHGSLRGQGTAWRRPC